MNSQDQRIGYLTALERKVLWLSSWMVHHANNIRDGGDGMKVGGHQASSASLATIMTALYFAALRPEDRVAVKPHASPNFHAIQYLLGKQSLDNLKNFRGFGGAQSYPSRTKDRDEVDFSTGSVGLGAALTIFASMVQDYIHAHGISPTAQKGRMIALVGDAELDEGNIYEALLEGWKYGLQNTWWIIDYNRQSLDAVVREDLHLQFERLFQTMGWDLVVLKYGKLQQAAFEEPGGHRLKTWIDQAPNQLYSALTFQGGAAWRRRLLDDLGDQGKVSSLIEKRSDEQLAALMGNLGGHDLPSILEAFEAIDHTRPVCFLCYTVKGFGLPLAGHKDNHAGLMNDRQIDRLREEMQVRPGHEWDRFEGLSAHEKELDAFLAGIPFARSEERQRSAGRVEVPAELTLPPQKLTSTQTAFGNLLNEIGRGSSDLAARIVSASPDVTVSTNLGPWVNRRGIFGQNPLQDVFREQRIAS
ncbi:MAG: transketolase, partial [Alphaproteobacteria bacterium]|nr:transketolase [Alphaproteobacteria bacterium]